MIQDDQMRPRDRFRAKAREMVPRFLHLGPMQCHAAEQKKTLCGPPASATTDLPLCVTRDAECPLAFLHHFCQFCLEPLVLPLTARPQQFTPNQQHEFPAAVQRVYHDRPPDPSGFHAAQHRKRRLVNFPPTWPQRLNFRLDVLQRLDQDETRWGVLGVMRAAAE